MDGLCTQAGMIRVGTTWEPEITTWYNGIIAVGSSISGANILVANDYVGGCKFDGVWTPQKAGCLLAGPDDLTGALVPLVGPAPTNANFVSGDYSRTAGLLGDGTSKGLRSNYSNDADPQDDRFLATYITEAATATAIMRYIDSGGGEASGGSHLRHTTTSQITVRIASTNLHSVSGSPPTGFFGASRDNASDFTLRVSGSSSTLAEASSTPASSDYTIFARGSGSVPAAEYSNARQSFYGLGEALDLALLDARLTTYMASLT